MAKINADVQLSPVKTHQTRVDEEDEEDDKGDGERMIGLLNAYRTPQKPSMDPTNYHTEGDLSQHEEPRRNEARTNNEDPQNDRRKSKSFLKQLAGLFYSQTTSVELSSQVVISEKEVPIPLDNGRGRSTTPPEESRSPVPLSDTLEEDAGMEPVDAAPAISGPLGNVNQYVDPTPSTEISLEANEVPSPASEEGILPEVARPLSIPSLIKSRPKNFYSKKRPYPRADTYEISPTPPPTDSNGQEYSDDQARKSRKRVKMTKKKEPKRPIVLPKIHKQSGTIVENLNSTEQDTLTGGTPIVQTESHPPSKRKRGRPRKAVQPDTSIPEVSSTHRGITNGASSSLDGAGISDNAVKGIEDPNAGEVVIGAPAVLENLGSTHIPDLGDGVSEILMNPSPVKPPHLPKLQRAVKNSDNNRTRRDSIDGEPNDSGDDSEDSPYANTNPLPRPTNPHRSSSPGNLRIDFDTLETVFNNLKRVGQIQVKGEWKYEGKPNTKIQSDKCKHLNRKLDLLNKAYDNLRDAKEAGRPEEDAQARIAPVFNGLKIATQRLVFNHLVPRGTQSQKEILADLYFFILKKYTHVIVVGAKLRTDDGFIESPALHELFELVDLLYDLVKSAVGLPKKYQPIAPNNEPVKTVRPIIEALRTAMLTEIEDRKGKQTLVELEAREAKRAKQAKVRQENQKQLDIEQRQKIKERRKRQVKALKEKYADPFWGRYMKTREAKAVDRLHAESVISSSTGRQHYEMDDDPFADDIERVSFFGNNNNRQHKKQPFSLKEKGRFVDIMRVDRGTARYDVVARALERSIEDVFDYAKEFQEAMDHEHENGRMNGPYDEWTYDVWVES